MAGFLLLYSTTDGHTLKICNRLAETLSTHGHDVDIAALGDAHPPLEHFDRVVIGASIRYGHHQPRVAAFIARHRKILCARDAAFFSVNLVARKPEKSHPQTNPYLRRFLRHLDWQPRQLAVFAGKLDYPRYRPLDRWMIRLIMWMTGGPTRPDTVCEYTDWRQVENFALALIGPKPPNGRTWRAAERPPQKNQRLS